MSDDLVKRLRNKISFPLYAVPAAEWRAASQLEQAINKERIEAADRIEELEAALRPFTFPDELWNMDVALTELKVPTEWIERARAALDGTPPEPPEPDQ